MNKKISYKEFADILTNEVPELREIYDSHLEDNGEIIPHVFINEVFYYLRDHINNNVPKYLTKLLRFLDEAMISSDEETKNLIAVSFVENLITVDNHSLKKIEALLGPNLKRELNNMRNWRPSPTKRKNDK